MLLWPRCLMYKECLQFISYPWATILVFHTFSSVTSSLIACTNLPQNNLSIFGYFRLSMFIFNQPLQFFPLGYGTPFIFRSCVMGMDDFNDFDVIWGWPRSVCWLERLHHSIQKLIFWEIISTCRELSWSYGFTCRMCKVLFHCFQCSLHSLVYFNSLWQALFIPCFFLNVQVLLE